MHERRTDVQIFPGLNLYELAELETLFLGADYEVGLDESQQALRKKLREYREKLERLYSADLRVQVP